MKTQNQPNLKKPRKHPLEFRKQQFAQKLHYYRNSVPPKSGPPTPEQMFKCLMDAAEAFGQYTDRYQSLMCRAIQLVEFSKDVLEPKLFRTMKTALDRLERDLLNGGPK